MSDRLYLIDNALSVLGVETAATKRVRRLVRDPLPGVLAAPDVDTLVRTLAADVDAGRVSADELPAALVHLAAAADTSPGSPLVRVRQAVTSLRNREASGLLAAESGKLRRATDGVIAGARREASEAERAARDAGVTSRSSAHRSSATLAVWERHELAATRVVDVLRAERILIEQGAIEAAPPAPESARERVERVIRRGGRVVEVA